MFLSSCQTYEQEKDSYDVQIFGTKVYNSFSEEDTVMRGNGVLLSDGQGITVRHIFQENTHYYMISPSPTNDIIPIDIEISEDIAYFSHNLPGTKIEVSEEDQAVIVDGELYELIDCDDESFCQIDTHCSPGMSGKGVYQDDRLIGLIEATNGEQCLIRVLDL